MSYPYEVNSVLLTLLAGAGAVYASGFDGGLYVYSLGAVQSVLAVFLVLGKGLEMPSTCVFFLAGFDNDDSDPLYAGTYVCGDGFPKGLSIALG